MIDAISKKQKLILFLVSIDGFNDQYQLVKILDQIDFPAKLEDNLQALLDGGLIAAQEFFKNGSPLKYKLTVKGKAIISQADYKKEMLSYFNEISLPAHLEKLRQFV